VVTILRNFPFYPKEVIHLAIGCLFILHTEWEMKKLAERLAMFLQPGDVLALEGELGAGKTTFAQGLAMGLGVQQQVDSPTFTIIKEYQGKYPFYHMDLYRITSVEEGIEDYFDREGICVVEWASRVKFILPEETLWVKIHVQPDGGRQVQLKSPQQERVTYVCQELWAK
jgi:tRNA threonylcarbamoyladenosine biosynthesis protein TsaE